MARPQIELAVSHLPTSTSFFLSALQPLGYHYIRQWGHRIGLGVLNTDFFLDQVALGMPFKTYHITFSAASRSMVRQFYSCALEAGGSPHGSPAARNDGGDCFNAAVLDFDGNSIEVVYHEDDLDSLRPGGSRVLRWSSPAEENLDYSTRIMDLNQEKLTQAAASAAASALIPAMASSDIVRSKAKSEVVGSMKSRSALSTVSEKSARAATEIASRKDVIETLQKSLNGSSGSKLIFGNGKMEISTKTLVGTMMGAAAGAAVAYAMCKSEDDSAKKEAEAYLASKRLEFSKRRPVLESSERRKSYPVESLPTMPRTRSSSVRSSSRRYSSMGAYPPPPYTHSTYMRPPPHVLPPMKAIEYMPPPSPTVSRRSMPRSATMPYYPPVYELPTDPRSEVLGDRRSELLARQQRELAADQRSAITAYQWSGLPVERVVVYPRSRSYDSRQYHSYIDQGVISRHDEDYPMSPRSTGLHSSRTSRGRKSSGMSHKELNEALFDDAALIGESPPPPDDHVAYLAERDELDTLLPSDSISCAGYRRKPSARRPSHRDWDSHDDYVHLSGPKSKSRTHRRKNHHSTDEKVAAVERDSVSKVDIDITVRGRRSRERSLMSLPIRSAEVRAGR